jgi:hypothetical protein
MPKPNDISQSPDAPQYTLGATTSEAKLANQIAKSKVPGPGAIVERLGRQWQLPRASVDSQINRDGHGLPNG